MIRYLVQEGASISVATTDGDTPLHLLLTGDEEPDRLECVKILVDAGCDPCAQNLVGETPLHRAAKCGYSSILEYLLSQGVPLPHDILLASETPMTLQFFLSKGLDLRGVAADGVTDLIHRVLRANLDFRRKNDAVEFARILIGAGWDPVLRNSAGETVIHVAARFGNIDAIKFFVSQNVLLPSNILLAALSPPSDVSVGVNDSYACQYHAVPLICFLIREGASVNVAASNGDTLLHLAMRNFTHDQHIYPPPQQLSWEVVEILLHGGSDPSA